MGVETRKRRGEGYTDLHGWEMFKIGGDEADF
jgi:hypothetical protein